MWVCAKCGETLEDQFDSCWKCACKIVVAPPHEKGDTTNGKKVFLALGYTMLVGILAFMLSLSDLATGRERAAPFLFPYAFLAGRALNDGNLFNLLLFGQFPVYGIVVAWSLIKRHVKGIVVIIILHILLAMSLDYLMNIERQYRVHFGRPHWPVQTIHLVNKNYV